MARLGHAQLSIDPIEIDVPGVVALIESCNGRCASLWDVRVWRNLIRSTSLRVDRAEFGLKGIAAFRSRVA